MLKIGIAGTFDVQNFGDLLFPLIAEAELTRRLGTIDLHRFSYGAKKQRTWPFTVTSIADLPEQVGDLDAMIIGGGDLIRFDKGVAPGYLPPNADIHHPTGYWLMPALLAQQNGCAVAWNALSAFGIIPDWAAPLMRTAIAYSGYVAVRDAPTHDRLAPFANGKSIAVVPDTCFGISRLVDRHSPSARYAVLREAAGLTRPYIIVQPVAALAGFASFVRKHRERLAGYQFVSLPISPALGDNDATLAGEFDELVTLPS